MQTKCFNAFRYLITICLAYFGLFMFARVIAARCSNRFAGQKAYEKPLPKPPSDFNFNLCPKHKEGHKVTGFIHLAASQPSSS